MIKKIIRLIISILVTMVFIFISMGTILFFKQKRLLKQANLLEPKVM